MPIRTFQFRGQAVITPSAGTIISKSVSQTLGLTDDGFPGFRRSPSDEITLLQFVSYVFFPGGVNATSDDLNLSQSVHVEGYETVESELNFTDLAEASYPTAESRSHSLNLLSDVVFSYGVRNFSNEDALGISDTVALALPASATNALNLTDSASRFTYRIEDENVVTDEVDWGYGKDAFSDVNLSHSADKTQKLRKPLTDSDVVTQSVAWFVESPCAKKQFKTFHGTGGVEPQSKKLNYKSTFLFQSLQDGEIVQLRNPATDDRRRTSFNRTNRTFFDGSLDLYADASWVTEQRQLYTITATKRPDLDTLFTFLENNLGLEVILKDWRGVTWVVIVTNPGEIFTEDAEDRWTLEFEVAGTAFDGEWAFQPLPITDDPSRAGSIYYRSASDTDILADGVGRNYEETVPTDATGLSDTATFTIV